MTSSSPGETHRPTDPDVSVVVPAANERDYLRGTLASIRDLDTAYAYETIVVDGDSTDGTRSIAAEYDTRILEQEGTGIGAARHQGALAADGEWLAFVDADTVLRANYLTRLLGFVEAEGLAAASSRCRITGPLRAKLMEATINHVFPRLEYPILPGFNFFVRRAAYERTGGFPNVPNEDTAFSRALARDYGLPTGYCPTVLVESSGRRIADHGLTGTLWHYGRLDVGRVRSGY
ncbi:glycosyltransferase [Halobacteria archaeon AArc-m2/3/4]|uniref:Glycosyltransferase n=1 Tax=Natronoglomus mannanivorans TaxID=2979990 RepID=A0AAP3E2Z5_9EURY|nr:glycosyltransferase [Halobacteria archaeon AArc-xg1-1]MCU4974761.1 glycosyltransferase [Halobacteria archaeon AArc-m2/3/4]